jgi:hypothetical protein
MKNVGIDGGNNSEGTISAQIEFEKIRLSVNESQWTKGSAGEASRRGFGFNRRMGASRHQKLLEFYAA